MKKPVLVIMAAGMGSRYGGMKQIDPVDEYGHINDTYRVTFENEQGVKKHYILQLMNKSIFKNPVELMENIVGVTEFLKRKISANGGNPERETFILKFTDRGRIWTGQGHSLNLSLIWNISGK